ncbi:MAG: tetratricopeptide repeat protein [Planctomycetota bacterium]
MSSPRILSIGSLALLAACVQVQPAEPAPQEASPLLQTAAPGEPETMTSEASAPSQEELDTAAIEARYRRALGGEPDPEPEPIAEPEAQEPLEQAVPTEVIQELREEVAAAEASVAAPEGKAWPKNPEQLEVWRSPEFQSLFTQGYLSRSELTPAVAPEEMEVLADFRDFVADEKFDKAIGLLEKSRTDTSTAALDLFLGNLYFQRGDLDQAAPAYQVAIAKFPRYQQAWQFLGTLELQRGNYAEASKALTKMLELGGATGQLYGMLGYCKANLGQHLAAESAYRMAVLLDPENTDWQLGLTRSLFEQGQYPAAISLCNNLLQKSPDRSELWLMQGEAYARSGQGVEAAKNFEMVERLGGANAASLSSLADIYAREGLFDLAGEAYLRALKADPAASEARALRGAQYLMGQGAVAEVQPLLNGLTSLPAGSLSARSQKEVLRLRAAIAVQEGDADEEARLLEESLRLDPMDGRTLIQLAQYKHRQGDLDQALFYFQRAAQIEGFEAEAQIAQGQALVRENRYAEALPLLKAGLKEKPNARLEAYIESVERLSKRGS